MDKERERFKNNIKKKDMYISELEVYIFLL